MIRNTWEFTYVQMNLPRIWIQARQMWWIIFSMIMQSLKSCQSSVVVSNWGLALKSTLKLCSCIINIMWVSWESWCLFWEYFGMLKHFSQLFQVNLVSVYLSVELLHGWLHTLKATACLLLLPLYSTPQCYKFTPLLNMCSEKQQGMDI